MRKIGEGVEFSDNLSHGWNYTQLMHHLADHRKFLADRVSYTPNGIRWSFGRTSWSQLRSAKGNKWATK